jgi:F-type H+/Na+-transporting ATPase subunit alpha
MSIKASEISELIKGRIEQFASSTQERNVGTVVTVTDGIVRVHGLADAKYGEMLEFPSSAEGSSFGLALNLEQDSVGAVVLGDYKHIVEGDTVKTTGRILEVPVGRGLLGRVVDALGRPIDGKGPIKDTQPAPIERVAPGVIYRKSVSQPVQTGYKAVDSMVPIGRGQRELIIGDRQTGKTAMAIDTIINQKSSGIKCIYVAIGQKQSSIANVVRKLEEHGAMDHTIIVAASASTPASMQYLAPYTGCAMGEFFMDNGEDALIIYDDLTKQAWAYRQISLLLRRPPGREAYPGDVFYLHSRLLERAARVNEEYVEKATNGRVKGKTGSLTGLPIIETQAGDVTAFVPTNVISITDGQIFLEGNLFNSGLRPAMNAGVSVSRVGGAAQTKIISKLSGGIKLALAQYRELAAFAQFASDLDDATRKQLERGQRTQELMKQKQYAPMSVAEMALSIYAVNNGFVDKVDIKKVGAYEAALQAFAKTSHKAVLEGINKNPLYSDDNIAGLKKICEEFATTGSY